MKLKLNVQPKSLQLVCAMLAKTINIVESNPDIQSDWNLTDDNLNDAKRIVNELLLSILQSTKQT